jgi:hypothetical protein
MTAAEEAAKHARAERDTVALLEALATMAKLLRNQYGRKCAEPEATINGATSVTGH